ncbi:MAG: hypothetical protein ACREP9_06975, partial [Candidatus Dormibacteraceae bacterium]
MRYRILAALVVGLVGALAVPVAASAHGGRSGDLSGSRGSGITSGPNGEAQTCGTGIASGDCHDILTDQGLQIGSSNGQVAGGFGITKHGMGVDGSVLGHDVSFGFPGLSSDMFGLGGSDGSKGPDSSIGLPQTGSCPMDTEVGKDIVG